MCLTALINLKKAICCAGSSATTTSGCNCTHWTKHLAIFLRCVGLSKEMAQRSLSSLQLKLTNIVALAITCQLAEVAATGLMVRATLAAIRSLRAPPSSV